MNNLRGKRQRNTLKYTTPIPQTSLNVSQVHDEESISMAAGQADAHMSYQQDLNN